MLARTYHVKSTARIASLLILGAVLLSACAPEATTQPAATGVPIQAIPSEQAEPTTTLPDATAIMPEATAQPTAGNVPVTGEAVQVKDHPTLGKILVDPNGMTLYTFEIDTPTESKCVDSDCVAFWPPSIVEGQPAASADLPGKLGTINRADGSQQLTYDGHPLYTFKLDQNPGDANGEGINEFGGVWHAALAGGQNNQGGSDNTTPQPPADNGYNYSY